MPKVATKTLTVRKTPVKSSKRPRSSKQFRDALSKLRKLIDKDGNKVKHRSFRGPSDSDLDMKYTIGTFRQIAKEKELAAMASSRLTKSKS